MEIKQVDQCYVRAISKLNNYFSPKRNRFYERRLFRKVRQEDGEKFEQFVLRLRTQAARCEFQQGWLEESLIDQIVEGCSSIRLRNKILSQCKTLDEIVILGSSLESVEMQSKSFQSNFTNNKDYMEVSRIIDKRRNTKQQPQSSTSKMKCFKCNSFKHLANDVSCPARNQQCNICRRKGHYAVVCRSSSKDDTGKYNNSNTKRIRAIKNTDNYEYDPALVKKPRNNDDEYIFHMGSDEHLEFEIGGVNLEMIVDSGARANVVSERDWKTLKNQRIKIDNQFLGGDKTLKAYGSDTPLQIIGTFDTIIKAGRKATGARFYVVLGGEQSLLGRKTATDLGVLKIEIPVNEILVDQIGIFPKLKGNCKPCIYHDI